MYLVYKSELTLMSLSWISSTITWLMPLIPASSFRSKTPETENTRQHPADTQHWHSMFLKVKDPSLTSELYFSFFFTFLPNTHTLDSWYKVICEIFGGNRSFMCTANLSAPLININTPLSFYFSAETVSSTLVLRACCVIRPLKVWSSWATPSLIWITGSRTR